VTEVLIKDQIKKLIELQKVDTDIYHLNVELEEQPIMLEELRQEFESKKAHLNLLEEKLKSIQLERKEQELELKSKEAEITKANTQLSQIKTNKEYTAKIGEIEGIKADQSIIEEKILESYEESDVVLADIEKEKEIVSIEESKFLDKKKEVEEAMKEIKEKVGVLTSQRKQQLSGVDSNYLARYDRILKHKGGVAIVPLQQNICSGCFMSITSQMLNEIKMQEKLVECEMCSRILYLEDEG